IGSKVGERPLFNVAPGAAFSFGDRAGWSGLRLSCDRPPVGGIDIPITSGRTRDPRLQVGYRIFSNCTEKSPTGCVGDVDVGYRDPADRGVVHPLTVMRPTRRPMGESSNLDSALPDVLDITLPQSLEGQDFTLVLEPKLGAAVGNQKFIFDLTYVDLTTTIYKVEE